MKNIKNEETKERHLDISDLTDEEYKELATYLEFIRQKRTMDFSFLSN